MIDYDCKHLSELRESKGLTIDNFLSHRMALSTQHIIALEKMTSIFIALKLSLFHL